MRNYFLCRWTSFVWIGFFAAVCSSMGAEAERMQAKQDTQTGQWKITDAGSPVLCYRHQTNYPGDLLAKVLPDNLKYARPRSDYIHPLYGLDGEELTRDWPVDHPHHRGIYWAWPEVAYRGELGDLHALQKVFARPTGKIEGKDGANAALITAENLWYWEDREAIVREVATIRAWRRNESGRFIDLEFQMTALKEGVTLARRQTKLYGGLNMRMNSVKDQQIAFHTDAEAPRKAWADLSGIFDGGKTTSGVAVFQHPKNPDYPGDWVKYPELNWFQPTFPAAETRFALSTSRPLILRYRLWIHAGAAGEQDLSNLWDQYVNATENDVLAK